MKTEVSFKVYKNIPPMSREGYKVGSNQAIYNAIRDEIEEKMNRIAEVHLALYLFNNENLFNLLQEISSYAPVTVISTPLSAYDSRKIGLAKVIYGKVAEKCKSTTSKDSFRLLIYPHMYVWYKAGYAELGASYSLHIKAGYIAYKDGSNKLLLTSCNMAPGDPPHSETAIIIDDSTGKSHYSEGFKKFFQEMEKSAVPWCSYNEYTHNLQEDLKAVFAFSFIGKHTLTDWNEDFVNYAFFTGPFISIRGRGSTHYAREKIIELIRSAKRRVLVCAQHVHDIAPFNGYDGLTLISALALKKSKDQEIDIRVLKQVSSRGLEDKRRASFVECHLDYAGVEQRANRLVHDKFIVADDTVAITTSNFTATQFAWGERDMKLSLKISPDEVKKVVESALSLYGHPKHLVRVEPVRSKKLGSKSTSRVVKKDIFAEVNGFIIIRDKQLADELASYFDELWNHKLSEDVEILR